jgi:ketosteroid isomerase-like protein
MAPLRGAGTALLPAVLLLCAACADPEAAPRDSGGPDWREVVEAERAFAAAARESGVLGAFRRFIHEDGILFRPGPVPGVAALAGDPETEGMLRWTPEVAGLSEDGALGFTSGPYQASGPDGAVTGTGRYVTLWHREAGDEFRFVLDVGVPGPGVEPFPDTLPVRRARVMTTRPVLGGRTLLVADSALQETYRSPDAGSLGGLAFPAGLRVLRRGREPARGPAAFLAAAREVADQGGLEWDVAGYRTSPDGTLGYVFGMARGAGTGPAAPFLRVWARGADGAWQLLVDLLDLGGEGS